MYDFRWITNALVGSWQKTKPEALDDAKKYGQAYFKAGNSGAVVLKYFATMERRRSPV